MNSKGQVKSKGASSICISISRPGAILAQQSQVIHKAVRFCHQPGGRLGQSTSHVPTGEINLVLEHIDDILQLPDAPDELKSGNTTDSAEYSTKCLVGVSPALA